MEEIIAFLRELRDHNDRAWFDAHRREWTHVKGLFASFVERLVAGIASFDPTVAGLRVQDCTYRIARDTRFSADKTPYKTHLGAYIAPRGKKSGFAGYYFHVEPAGDHLGGHLLSAGLYCAEPVVVRSVREEILDHGDEMMAAIRGARHFRLYEGNRLKRTPVGFPAGTPYDELLKMKDFYVERFVDEAFLTAPGLVERAVDAFRPTQPFIALLNRAVQYAYEEMK